MQCAFVKTVADWAEKLTQMGRGKHHLGDFLPPEELEKFMETYNVSFDVLNHVISKCSEIRYQRISCLFLNCFNILKGTACLYADDGDDLTGIGCKSLQSAYCHQHVNTQYLQAGCSSCCPTNSVNALRQFEDK